MTPSGLTPMLLRPVTRLLRSGPLRMATVPLSAVALISVCGWTAVTPWLKGLGCEICGVSVTCTVSVP